VLKESERWKYKKMSKKINVKKSLKRLDNENRRSYNSNNTTYEYLFICAYIERRRWK
jgi:predicted metalloprotease